MQKIQSYSIITVRFISLSHQEEVEDEQSSPLGTASGHARPFARVILRKLRHAASVREDSRASAQEAQRCPDSGCGCLRHGDRHEHPAGSARSPQAARRQDLVEQQAGGSRRPAVGPVQVGQHSQLIN